MADYVHKLLLFGVAKSAKANYFLPITDEKKYIPMRWPLLAAFMICYCKMTFAFSTGLGDADWRYRYYSPSSGELEIAIKLNPYSPDSGQTGTIITSPFAFSQVELSTALISEYQTQLNQFDNILPTAITPTHQIASLLLMQLYSMTHSMTDLPLQVSDITPNNWGGLTLRRNRAIQTGEYLIVSISYQQNDSSYQFETIYNPPGRSSKKEKHKFMFKLLAGKSSCQDEDSDDEDSDYEDDPPSHDEEDPRCGCNLLKLFLRSRQASTTSTSSVQHPTEDSPLIQKTALPLGIEPLNQHLPLHPASPPQAL